MFVKALTALLVAIAAVAVPVVGSAHDSKDPRHIAMTGLAKDMKAIAGQAKAGRIEPSAVAAAARVEDTAGRMLELFPAGSGTAHDRAKPEIWSDWAGFTAKATEFERAAADLLAATASGDPGRVGMALKAAGQSCKSCHRPYRKPKKAE